MRVSVVCARLLFERSAGAEDGMAEPELLLLLHQLDLCANLADLLGVALQPRRQPRHLARRGRPPEERLNM